MTDFLVWREPDRLPSYGSRVRFILHDGREYRGDFVYLDDTNWFRSEGGEKFKVNKVEWYRETKYDELR